ncbi:hypothetical protein [Halorussus caseinilyticus]|uniref:hypothetical protein n=1 Tax=Halorussus caseinilyticus TaxID=3034025 RepID=UPI0023E8A048|nr:hypothetical protein [Halorussus sp. DT72]
MTADVDGSGPPEEGEEMILISAGRSEEEKRDAYSVEWREPANAPSLADRIRSLF